MWSPRSLSNPFPFPSCRLQRLGFENMHLTWTMVPCVLSTFQEQVLTERNNENDRIMSILLMGQRTESLSDPLY